MNMSACVNTGRRLRARRKGRLMTTTMQNLTTALAPERGGRGSPSAALALPEVRWAVSATGLFVLGGLAELAGMPGWVWWSLYLACYAAGGWEPALAGIQALREKTLDVDILMIVAALVAATIGQVFDGALLIVIFATSGALEAFATRRTQDSVQALLTLAPESATRLTPAGIEEEVDTGDLAVGDLVLVRPVERIGADGEVLDGLSEVDQASITGEPMPVTKQVGDEVFAGTLNGAGALSMVVNRAARDTVVARIVALVQEASATKAKTQLFIEKVEQRYSMGVVTANSSRGGVTAPIESRCSSFSMTSCVFALVAEASCTSATILATTVSRAARFTTIERAPAPLSVPANTSSPTCLVTGIGSPVIEA